MAAILKRKNMRKTIFISLAAFLLAAGAASAAQNQDIPEKNGAYDVPGRPDMKVRVFVHHPKAKPSALLQCSVNDPDSSAVVGPTKWKLPAGDWKYYLNAGSAPSSVGSLNFSRLADLSFAIWQNTEIETANVNLKYEGSTTLTRKALDGKNIVTFGSTSGSALGVTYTWYYPSTGMAVETDTILNKKFTWSWTPYLPDACPNVNTYDAQNILTHELGHWLGLNDHYTVDFANNTMYGYGAKGEIKKDTLTTGDKAGVNNIY